MSKQKIEFEEFKKDYCEFPNIDEEISYIGLRIIKNEMENKRFKFIFPVSYYTESEYNNLVEENLKFDIENLLKAIYKTNVSEIYNDSRTLENTCPIDSYLWIIRNYLSYGYYIENELTYSKKGKGKIDWKQTIKNNKFYITEDLDFIYSEYVLRQNQKNINSIITKIHKYCVYEAVRIFGPFCGVKLQSIEKPEIEMKQEYMIYLLKNEYIKTFLDSKKELLKNMIHMLEWLNNENMSYDMFSIESNKFELVFEKLINEKFGNVDEISNYYPFASWNIEGKSYNSSKLKEDTVIDLRKLTSAKNEIIIIDSKYYKYAYYEQKEKTNKLPPTSSITKQIVYGEYVKKYINDNNVDIYNVFLIPFNKENDKNDYIEYVGYADTRWKDSERKEKYEKIYTFKIDLKDLVNNKLGKKQECIIKLKKCLENVIS